MNKNISSPSPSRQTLNWRASVRRLRACGLIGGALFGLAAIASHAQAQDNYTYTGTAASGGTAAAPATSTFTTGFTDTTTSAANVTPASPAGTLTFGGTASYTATDDIGSLTLSGFAFTNTAGTVTIAAGTGAAFVGTGATLGFSVSTGVVAFAPAINEGTSTLTFSGGGTGSQTTINGVISGSGGMTDGIAGTLTLNAINTYTGGTTVTAGILALNKGGATGAIQGPVTINTGATLSLTAGDALGYSTTAGSTVTVLNVNGGTVNNATGNNEGFLTNFNLTGGTVSSTGGGIFYFGSTNSTVGITSNASATTSLISAPINAQNSNLTFTVAQGTVPMGGADLSVTGVIGQFGTQGIVKAGLGNLSLGAINTFTGGATVNAGTLTLANGGSAADVRGVITVNTGGTLSLTAGDALGYGSATTVTTMVNVNGGTVTSGNFNEGYLTSYNLTGGTVAAGGLYRFNVNATAPPTIASSASGATSFFNAGIDDFASGGATATSNLTVTVAPGTTANGVDLQIGGGIISAGGLTKAGTGYLNLTGQNSFTGPVNVTAGTLNVGTVGAAATSALGADNTTKVVTVSSGATLSGTVNNWFGNGTQNSGGTTPVSTLPTITLNGGALTTTRYTAIGALNLNAATVTASAIDTGNYQAFALTGNVTVGGTAASTITSTNVTANRGGYHLGTNTTFTVAATGSANPDLTVSAPLINPSGDFGGPTAAGGLTKAGAGTMLLTATNTYTGPTAISAGTLLVNGSTVAGSAVAVNGGVLGGTGTAAGPVTVNAGGTINPGPTGAAGSTAAVGTLRVGALTLSASTSGLAFDLNATASYDKLVSSGAVNLALGSFTANIGTGTFNNGDVLTLISGTSLTPFNAYAQGAVVASNGTFNFTADYTTTANAFDLDVTPVPEPSTWLGAVMLVGLAGVTQRRKINGWLKTARV